MKLFSLLNVLAVMHQSNKPNFESAGSEALQKATEYGLSSPQIKIMPDCCGTVEIGIHGMQTDRD